jgi:hypothetical protein
VAVRVAAEREGERAVELEAAPPQAASRGSGSRPQRC